MKEDIKRNYTKGPKYKGYLRKEYPRQIDEANLRSGKTDLVPQREGMGKYHYGHGTMKWSLLFNFLNSRVGKPWDEVYSEICERVDSRTYAGKTLRSDLSEYMVSLDCFVNEKEEICTSDGMPLTKKRFAYRKWFYVHPVKKTLERIPEETKNKKQENPKIFEWNGTYFYLHEDHWYRVEMQQTENIFDKWGVISDIFGTKPKDYKEKYGLDPDGRYWYVHKKESANSKEISELKKKYNLQGD